jgi:cytochrome P450
MSSAQATIPGPSGPRMVQNIRLMRRDPPAFLAACAERYGAVVAFPIPRASVLYIDDPLDVRRVLQTNHAAYGKRTVQYDALAMITGHGLLASDGDLWRRMRRTLQPAFHHRTIDSMADAIQRPVDDWVAQQELRCAQSRSANVVDVDNEMLRLTLEIVGATLFGAALRSEAATVVDAVMRALHIVIVRSQMPVTVPSWLPTFANRRLAQSLAELDMAVDRVIASRRTRPLGDDALSLLLVARDEGLASDTEVRDEVVTMIVAGHETVAATLTWSWLLLAQHPDVEARLHAEVDALPRPPWTASVTERLPYTRAVIEECLRLYPPAWVITRRSLAHDVLGGYDVPIGSTVIMSPYLLHRDSAVWTSPESFTPERFLTTPDRTSYFPFGAGPRLCIGRDLSLFEAPLVLARLTRAFTVRPTAVRSPRCDFGVTLRPVGGLSAVISPR